MFYLFLAIYSIIILTIGFLIRKGSKDFKEYFLAGRTLSWRSFSLTMSATWFGATSIIVLIDESFLKGLGSIWVMIIPTLMTLSLFVIFSDKIRRSNFVSIPEILKNSYGNFFHFISSITIFFYLLLLSSSQAVALGKVISNFINLDFEFSLILGVTFVFLYSFRGGLLSVVRTDFFQLFMVFFRTYIDNIFYNFCSFKEFFK
jgi:SSS family solute:Na+ symporter